MCGLAGTAYTYLQRYVRMLAEYHLDLYDDSKKVLFKEIRGKEVFETILDAVQCRYAWVTSEGLEGILQKELHNRCITDALALSVCFRCSLCVSMLCLSLCMHWHGAFLFLVEHELTSMACACRSSRLEDRRKRVKHDPLDCNASGSTP